MSWGGQTYSDTELKCISCIADGRLTPPHPLTAPESTRARGQDPCIELAEGEVRDTCIKYSALTGWGLVISVGQTSSGTAIAAISGNYDYVCEHVR